MPITWFLLDLGNTVIKLAYERVLENICRDAKVDRDALVEILEKPGGYRDLERGAVSFSELHELLVDRAGYTGSLARLREVWCDFFDGTVPGIEELMDELRRRYRIAFLSNSNEVHAELIPRRFAGLFRRDDRFILSHRFRAAKPDPEIFRRALEVIGALSQHVVFVDDLLENVLAARGVGLQAFQFLDAESLREQLVAEGLL